MFSDFLKQTRKQFAKEHDIGKLKRQALSKLNMF